MSNQYLRKWQLLLKNSSTVLDISPLHFRFNITQNDLQSPDSARVRIFNLDPKTAAAIQNEYTDITLLAGYQDAESGEKGNFGTIFTGTLKQSKVGRENETDTFLDIYAADGDIAYNYSTIQQPLAAGQTAQDAVGALSKQMGTPLDPAAPPFDLTGAAYARGKVLSGMCRDEMRNLGVTHNFSWTIRNGKLVIIPFTAYLPGTAVNVNSANGMIGVPEQTQDGIKIKLLLNPQLRVGCAVKLDNKDIISSGLGLGVDPATLFDVPGNTAAQNQALVAAAVAASVPPIAADGLYRVLVCEYEGDNRGEPWFSEITCLQINPSVPAAQSVPANPSGPAAGANAGSG
jgi:hypothetical protein